MRSIIILVLIINCFAGTAQGLLFNDQIYTKAPDKPQLMRGDGYHIPPSASLKGYCPPPGNQVGYATSVGWAVGWSARTILYAKNNNLKGKDITPHIFAPAYIYQKAAGVDAKDCASGITLEAGLQVLKEHGIPKLNEFYHFCHGTITDELDQKALQFRINDYAKLFGLYDKSTDKIESVKRSIKEGYPVVAGIIATPSFSRAKDFWQPVEVPDNEHLGQAVCIVGYDDEKYGGAFEIMNSWGKDWGNDGFLWIRYKDFDDYVKYAYELFEIPSHNTKIAGSIEFQLSTGEDMPVEMIEEGYFKMKNSYKGGETFRIFINNEDPGFLYVFGTDLTNTFFPIFPYDESVSAALNYKPSRIAIPDETSLIKFDNTAGTDYLCVLYSREELNINNIMSSIRSASGDFYTKIQSTLNPDLLNSEMNWTTNKVAFEGDASEGNLVAVVVEINHH